MGSSGRTADSMSGLNEGSTQTMRDHRLNEGEVRSCPFCRQVWPQTASNIRISPDCVKKMHDSTDCMLGMIRKDQPEYQETSNFNTKVDWCSRYGPCACTRKDECPMQGICLGATDPKIGCTCQALSSESSDSVSEHDGYSTDSTIELD